MKKTTKTEIAFSIIVLSFTAISSNVLAAIDSHEGQSAYINAAPLNKAVVDEKIIGSDWISTFYETCGATPKIVYDCPSIESTYYYAPGPMVGVSTSGCSQPANQDSIELVLGLGTENGLRFSPKDVTTVVHNPYYGDKTEIQHGYQADNWGFAGFNGTGYYENGRVSGETAFISGSTIGTGVPLRLRTSDVYNYGICRYIQESDRLICVDSENNPGHLLVFLRKK